MMVKRPKAANMKTVQPTSDIWAYVFVLAFDGSEFSEVALVLHKIKWHSIGVPRLVLDRHDFLISDRMLGETFQLQRRRF